jgi:hypothetical protein
MENGGDWGELTFINENKTQIISGRVLLIHFPESRGKIETPEEQSDWNSLSS